MKKYKVTYEKWHETFNGGDSFDGEYTLFVNARDYKSARKKGEKEIERMTKGFIQSVWGNIIGIEEEEAADLRIVK